MKSEKAKITKKIIRYLSALNTLEKFHAEYIAEYACEKTDREFKICDLNTYGESVKHEMNRKFAKQSVELVKRYMRELRDQGKICFDYIDSVNGYVKCK